MIYIHGWLRALSFCFTSQQCCLCSQSWRQRELTLSGVRRQIPLIPQRPPGLPEAEDVLVAPHTSKGLRVQLGSGLVKYEHFSVCDSEHMCFGLCVHPERLALGQMQADNILRETLRCCILTSNCSNVYSNQRHNRWRGMNFWQAGMSYSSFTCGFWCLLTASQEELTHFSVSCINEVLSAAVNVLRATCAEMCALILLKCNLHTKILITYHYCYGCSSCVLELYAPIMRPSVWKCGTE